MRKLHSSLYILMVVSLMATLTSVPQALAGKSTRACLRKALRKKRLVESPAARLDRQLRELSKQQAESKADFDYYYLPWIMKATPLPEGEIPYRASFEGIRGFLGDGAKVFSRLQSLEAEVLRKSIQTGLSKESALEKLIEEEEVAHGFESVISLEDRRYPKEEYLGIIARGHPFNDSGSAELDHGALSHRLQWFLIMREMKLDPAKFMANGEVPSALTLYRAIGALPPEFGRTLWDTLFDARMNRFTSPEYMKIVSRIYLKGLGQWK